MIWSICYFCCGCCCDSGNNNNEFIDNFQQEPGAVERGQHLVHTTRGYTICSRDYDCLPTSHEIQELRKKLTKTTSYVYSRPFTEMSKITDYLFMTSFGGICEESIRKNKIAFIVSVTHETPLYKVDGIHNIRIPAEDHRTENIYKYFDDISDIITEMETKEVVTLVHCRLGRSRSATITMAHLMKSQRMSLDLAYDLVKSKRPFIGVNPGFIRQLLKYEI
ncbi:dual specificity protein phosphatase 21-like [Oppia nitens]|uniref:dual specificity protein phosphatase 21-like n=1 Tax=Oppia nitens TaxID=1686743 RepID=UPI0023DB3D10|nr:dual specificity protein phosphatase 21-like [Oppia nitens]